MFYVRECTARDLIMREDQDRTGQDRTGFAPKCQQSKAGTLAAGPDRPHTVNVTACQLHAESESDRC